MATVQPGPLVSSISGSVAGSTFSQRAEGCILRPRSSPARHSSNALSVPRRLLSNSASTWCSLSAAARAAWDALAARLAARSSTGRMRNYTGFSLFCANLIAQAGRTSPAVATAPGAYVDPAPCYPLLYQAADGIRTRELSRNLALGESLIVRALREHPAHITRPAYRLAQASEITNADGLYDQPQKGQHITAFSHTLLRSPFTYGPADCCFEFWVKFDQPLNASYHFFFETTSPNTQFFIYNHKWYFYRTVSQFFATRQITDTAWHYVTLNYAQGATATLTCYLDGVQLGSPLSYAPITFGGNLIFGDNFGGIYNLKGSLDEIRFSSRQRTPAEITAAWNGGAGRPFQVDADTWGLWHLDYLASARYPDSTLAGRFLAVSVDNQVDGVFSRLLFPLSTRRLAPPCTSRFLSVPGVNNLFLAPPYSQDFSWS